MRFLLIYDIITVFSLKLIYHSYAYEKFADGTEKCIQDEIPFELPEGWCWCRLKDIFSICSSKRVLQSDWKNSGIPFYRAREIVRLSEFGFVNNELFISEEHYQNLKTTYGVPQVGDLMVSGVGTIGKVYIVKENDRFYYKDASVLCFQNTSSIIIPSFAKYLLESEFMQSQMHSCSKGTTVDTITISTAMEYICLLPPLSEQQKIVLKLNELLHLVDVIETDKTGLQSTIQLTKSKILDLAIRGKLVPQAPDDEPASVLLERIRAEKEELIKQGKIKRDSKESVIFKGEDNSYYENIGNKNRNIDDEIPFDIPENWQWCNLSMIGQTNIGLTYSPKDIDPNGTIVLRSSNIVNNHLDFSDLVRVNMDIKDNQLVENNDILICARNGSKSLVGKCALINNMIETASFGAFMAIYRTICYSYVFYYLQTSVFRDIFYNSNSTAINQLTQVMIKTAHIPLPPLNEQKRIADKVSQLFSLLDSIAESVN